MGDVRMEFMCPDIVIYLAIKEIICAASVTREVQVGKVGHVIFLSFK